jgi:hypothetical protein
MTKCRIIERTHPSGRKEWVIQQKHWLLKWKWVDAWRNMGYSYLDHYSTLERAKDNLWQFDGSKPTNKVVWPI